MKRVWRKPIEADKTRKCRARNLIEGSPFYAVWNETYECWCLAEANHILVLVSEVLEPRQ